MLAGLSVVVGQSGHKDEAMCLLASLPLRYILKIYRKEEVMSKNAGKSLLLKFRKRDSAFGVTRETWKDVADALGLSETEAIHVAMSRLAHEKGKLKMEAENWAQDAPEFEGVIADPILKEPTLEETSLLGENWKEVRQLGAALRRKRMEDASNEGTTGGRDRVDEVAG